MRHVGGARHAGQIALDLGIQRQPVLLVLLLLCERLGPVRNLPLDHADTRRHGANGAQRQDRGRRDRPVRAGAQGHGGPRRVQLDVVVGLVERLPDAVQVGMAIGQPGGAVRGRLPRNRQGHRRQHGPEPRCDEHRDQSSHSLHVTGPFARGRSGERESAISRSARGSVPAPSSPPRPDCAAARWSSANARAVARRRSPRQQPG